MQSASTQGLGDRGAFFDLCKAGDCGGVMAFLKSLRDPKYVQLTLDSVDNHNKSGLHHAVDNDHITLVQYLLNKGAKIDARDKLL